MTEIRELVQSLGIHSTYRGYEYLCYGVSLCMEDKTYLLEVYKRLYTDIGAHYGKKRDGVERALRTVITVCWENGSKERFREIAGYPVRDKPSAGQFLAILTEYMERGRRVEKVK